MENIIKPHVIRFPSKRVFLGALIALFLLLVIILCAGWFIGAIPAYPHMRNWKVCEPPQVITLSLYGVENSRKELFMAICFNTTDSWEQVAAWYDPLGWTGENVPTDIYGMGLTGEINFGRVAQITSKR